MDKDIIKIHAEEFIERYGDKISHNAYRNIPFNDMMDDIGIDIDNFTDIRLVNRWFDRWSAEIVGRKYGICYSAFPDEDDGNIKMGAILHVYIDDLFDEINRLYSSMRATFPPQGEKSYGFAVKVYALGCYCVDRELNKDEIRGLASLAESLACEVFGSYVTADTDIKKTFIHGAVFRCERIHGRKLIPSIDINEIVSCVMEHPVFASGLLDLVNYGHDTRIRIYDVIDDICVDYSDGTRFELYDIVLDGINAEHNRRMNELCTEVEDIGFWHDLYNVVHRRLT